MIINSILSLAFLWSWKKCLIRLKQLRTLRKKISSTPIQSVMDVVKKLEEGGQGKKIFAVIKGIIHRYERVIKTEDEAKRGKLSEIKSGSLADHFLKKSWEDLAEKAHWKHPYKSRNIEFNLQDLHSERKISIKECNQASLSGALSEIIKDRNIQKQHKNIFLRAVLKIYNIFVRKAPLSYLFGPTKVGEELTLYGILDGQYSLVIGQFQKQAGTNQIICKNPNYVTKQKGYVQSRILTQQTRLILINFLLACLLIITGIKFIRKVYEEVKKWRMRNGMKDDEGEERSQDEGDNCNCIVCYENVRNIIFKPCLHYAVCKTCFKLLPRSVCPMCKTPIEDTIQIVKKK